MSTKLQPYEPILDYWAYTPASVRDTLAEAHRHYETQISAATEDDPSIAQMEAGAQALHECGFGGEEGKAARAATADSVWRAMQEVPGAPPRVAHPAASLAAWRANNVPELQQRMYRVSDVEAMRDALLPECWEAAIASVQPAGADPIAWVRWRSDGGYEGPLMHAQMDDVRKRSGAWTPLYGAPQTAGDAAMPVVAGSDYEEKVLDELRAIANDKDGDFWPTMTAIGALGIIGRQQANCAKLEERVAGLEADLVEELNRIASMRTEWGAEAAALTEQHKALAERMQYRGNSVEFIHQKKEAYGEAIDRVFLVLSNHGFKADGYSHVADLAHYAMQNMCERLDEAKTQARHAEDVADAAKARIAELEESAKVLVAALHDAQNGLTTAPSLPSPRPWQAGKLADMGGAGITVTLAQPDILDLDAPDRRPQPCCGDPTNCDAAAMGLCSPAAASEAAGVAACVTCGAPVEVRRIDSFTRTEVRPGGLEWSEPWPKPVFDAANPAAPCGECHLHTGEQCDICGARQPIDTEPGPTIDAANLAPAAETFMHAVPEPASDDTLHLWIAAMKSHPNGSYDNDGFYAALRAFRASVVAASVPSQRDTAAELAEHMRLVDKLAEAVAWNQRAMGRGALVSGENEVDARAAVEASARKLLRLP
jgi:hypothetical protein